VKREPTDEEQEEIRRAIFQSDRIEATSLYISITECGLTEAQNHIKALTEELQAKHPEQFTRKQKRKI
jgi:uncharacterized coiled-coil protein SlyX